MLDSDLTKYYGKYDPTKGYTFTCYYRGISITSVYHPLWDGYLEGWSNVKEIKTN